METIKSTLAKAATELAQRTAQSSQAKLDLDEKRKRLDAARKRYAVLKRRLETEFSQLDTMEAKVEELESMRKVSAGSYGSRSRCGSDGVVSLYGGRIIRSETEHLLLFHRLRRSG